MAVHFARQATGLVRQANAADVFIYNVNFVNLGTAALMLLFLPSLAYPGLNVYLSIIICALLTIPTSLVYATFASSMPRSGGDYVYVSRALSPLVGFVANWNFTVWCIYSIGVVSAFPGRFGLAPVCRTLGVYWRQPALFSHGQWATSPQGLLLSGTLLILLSAGILVIGIRAYMRFMRILFAVAMGGLIASILIFLLNTPATASVALDHYVKALTGHVDTYRRVLSSPEGNPITDLPFSLRSTVISVTWPFVALGYSIGSAYIGGEVKGAARAQLIGMPGSLVYSAFWLLLLSWALFHAFGYSFMQHLAGVDPSTLLSTSSDLGFIPTFSELSALLTQNVYAALLAELGLLAWCYVFLPLYMIIVTRNLLAWTLDGLLPSKVAQVNDRTHSPLWAIAVGTVLGILSLFIYAYLIPYSTISPLFGQAMGTYVVTCAAAVVFPWRQRDIFESSPVAWRIGKLPVLSILGILGVIGSLIVGWAILSDPFSGISVQRPLLLCVSVSFFASGFVVFWLVKWIRSRQGVDVTLAFAEIPPE